MTTSTDLAQAAVDEQLRRHVSAHDTGLLDELATCRMLRDHLDQHMRHLVAIARHFTYPRPYTLHALAEATGMSISGLRTYITDGDIQRVADALDRTTSQEGTQP